MSDLDHAKRAALGDKAALERLYDYYADPLFAFVCHHMRCSRHEEEEVWQDTWMAAVRSISTYRGQSHFFTWLCSIARRKIADHYRRQGRDSADLFSTVTARQLSELMDVEPLPEEILVQRDICVSVVEAMMTLPEDYHKALMARYVDGVSVNDVARMLGKNYKAAESLLTRARKALRSALVRIRQEQYDG